MQAVYDMTIKALFMIIGIIIVSSNHHFMNELLKICNNKASSTHSMIITYYNIILYF